MGSWIISDYEMPIAGVEADSALEALSVYAELEGFVRYDEMDEETRAEFTYTLPDGRLGAMFTSYEIVATEQKES